MSLASKLNDNLPSFEDRQALLTSRRNLKMARSAHAYVRGATLNFYAWLERSHSRALPEAPPVWICGDCHAGNLGPVASAKGKIRIQIRDLDQTVIGNPAHDLIRLGLSLATAARGSDLPGVTTARMLEEMIGGYQETLSGEVDALKAGRAGRGVRDILERSTRRRWDHLAQERLEHIQPTIPLGKRFWPLSEDERREIDALMQTEQIRTLITSLKERDAGDEIELLDAAYWMKGCSSLGRLRYAVLLGIGRTGPNRGTLCLVDIKEAVEAAAPRGSTVTTPTDDAVRVVEGARNLSPYLGERMAAARVLDTPVVVRELMPQDLKLEIDQLTQDEAVRSARFLAAVVGHAHARQMDDVTRRSWNQELARHHSKTLDAPSWLWSSVVDLVAYHEAGYLEHCRRYAMQTAA